MAQPAANDIDNNANNQSVSPKPTIKVASSDVKDNDIDDNKQQPKYSKFIKKDKVFDISDKSSDISISVEKLSKLIVSSIATEVTGGTLLPILENQIKDMVINISWSSNMKNEITTDHFFENDTYIFVEIVRNVSIKKLFGKSIKINGTYKYLYIKAANGVAKAILEKKKSENAVDAFNYIDQNVKMWGEVDEPDDFDADDDDPVIGDGNTQFQQAIKAPSVNAKLKIQPGSNDLSYYIIDAGLNIGGVCNTKTCKAGKNNEPVIYQRGFDDKIYALDEHNDDQYVCPGCEKPFTMNEFLLYKCNADVVYLRPQDDNKLTDTYNLLNVSHYINLGKNKDKHGNNVTATEKYIFLKFVVTQ